MTPRQFISKIPEEIRLHPLGQCKSLSELVLDPEVWKAVNMEERWSFIGVSTPGWKMQMYRMIKSIADGKSLEEYLTTL